MRVFDSRPGRPATGRSHGLRATYQHAGCRCDQCREAENEYQRDYKRQRRELMGDTWNQEQAAYRRKARARAKLTAEFRTRGWVPPRWVRLVNLPQISDQEWESRAAAQAKKRG